MHTWDYMEEKSLSGKNNLQNDFSVPPASIDNSMAGLTGQFVAAYYCPADALGNDQTTASPHQRRRGNYVVNWGNTKYDTPPPTTGTAPFAHLNGGVFAARLSNDASELFRVTSDNGGFVVQGLAQPGDISFYPAASSRERKHRRHW